MEYDGLKVGALRVGGGLPKARDRESHGVERFQGDAKSNEGWSRTLPNCSTLFANERRHGCDKLEPGVVRGCGHRYSTRWEGPGRLSRHHMFGVYN